MEIKLNYSKANPEAHNYAVDKLREKFGKKGHCTILDYVILYCEGLEMSCNKTNKDLKK
jgi:hypothetical protein